VEILERVDVAGGRPRNAVEYEHWARYRWALQFARGEILDIACGTGHGSALLSEGGKVTGVDRDREALAIAQSRVRGGRFVMAKCPPIPLPDKAFDTVVSLETLEHIAEDEAFVAEIRRVLRSGGALILSTPNSRVSSPEGEVSNPWHVREYALDDLRALLEPHFDEVDIFAQRHLPTGLRRRIAGAAWRVQDFALRSGVSRRRIYGSLEVSRPTSTEPVNWVLVCR
jgi:SAM-dependent methyltransferase